MQAEENICHPLPRHLLQLLLPPLRRRIGPFQGTPSAHAEVGSRRGALCGRRMSFLAFLHGAAVRLLHRRFRRSSTAQVRRAAGMLESAVLLEREHLGGRLERLWQGIVVNGLGAAAGGWCVVEGEIAD